MLRTEDRIQRDARSLRQHVDGPASLRIDPGLIGQQPNFLLAGGGANRIEVVRFEHVDPGLHRSVARGHAAQRRSALRCIQ